MTSQVAQHSTIDIIAHIPHRSDSRLVLDVNTKRYEHVLSKIGAVWGVANVDVCAVSCFAPKYETWIRIASQEEWMFMLRHKFFRCSDDEEDWTIALTFHRKDNAELSNEELSMRLPSRSATAVSRAEEQAAYRGLKAAHNAQAAEIAQLKSFDAINTSNIHDLAASQEDLQARHDELNAAFAAQSYELANLKTAKDAQAREVVQLKSQITRISTSYASQIREQQGRKSSKVSTDGSSILGKRKPLSQVDEDRVGPLKVNSSNTNWNSPSRVGSMTTESEEEDELERDFSA